MKKSIHEKIQAELERKKQIENEIKRLIQKERAEEKKARTHRLCKRGGIVEKLLPELATFTDEQFDVFLNKVLLTAQTKRIIADIAVIPNFSPAEPQGTVSVPQNSDTVEAEPAEADNDIE